MLFRGPDLGNRYVHCYWVLAAPKPFSGQSSGIRIHINTLVSCKSSVCMTAPSDPHKCPPQPTQTPAHCVGPSSAWCSTQPTLTWKPVGRPSSAEARPQLRLWRASQASPPVCCPSYSTQAPTSHAWLPLLPP